MHRRRRTRDRIQLLTLLLLLPVGAADAGVVHGQGILWRVTGPQGTAPSYILGTMHSDDERVLNLAPAVEDAFADAQRYAFELDFRRDVQQTMARAMFDRAPPMLDSQLGDTDWQRAKAAAAERGVPANALPLMDPWAVAITILIPPMDPSQSLDHVLFRRAIDRERPVTGLETAAEQIALFDDLPEEEQLGMLRSALDLAERDALAPMYEQLTDAWLRGDLDRLMEISESNPMLPDDESNDAFERRVVDERNERMAERMQPLIDRGGAFVAIGALHLPGGKGVLRLLEQAGYEVEAVD